MRRETEQVPKLPLKTEENAIAQLKRELRLLNQCKVHWMNRKGAIALEGIIHTFPGFANQSCQLLLLVVLTRKPRHCTEHSLG